MTGQDDPLPEAEKSAAARPRQTGSVSIFSRLADVAFCISAYLALPATCVLVGWDISQRLLWNLPPPWTYELVSLLLLITVTGVLPAIFRDGLHLRVTLLYDHLPAPVRTLVDLLTALLTAVVFGLLGYRLVQAAIEMYEFGDRTLHLPLPYWPFALFVAAVSVLWAILALRAPPLQDKRGPPR